MIQHHQEMLSKIRAGAVRAFGEDHAQGWLCRSWKVFDDRSPLDMAKRDPDAQRVLDYVARLVAAEDALKTAGIADCEH